MREKSTEPRELGSLGMREIAALTDRWRTLDNQDRMQGKAGGRKR